jgi:hypothetical protein
MARTVGKRKAVRGGSQVRDSSGSTLSGEDVLSRQVLVSGSEIKIQQAQRRWSIAGSYGTAASGCSWSGSCGGGRPYGVEVERKWCRWKSGNPISSSSRNLNLNLPRPHNIPCSEHLVGFSSLCAPFTAQIPPRAALCLVPCCLFRARRCKCSACAAVTCSCRVSEFLKRAGF